MSEGETAGATAARFFAKLGEVNQRTAEHAAVLDVHRARMDRIENRLTIDEQRRSQLQADLAAVGALLKETVLAVSVVQQKHDNLQNEFFARLTKTLEQAPRLTLKASLGGSLVGGAVVLCVVFFVLRLKGIAL